MYGVTEMINALKIHSIRKQAERNQPAPKEETVAEEISSTLNTPENTTPEPTPEPTIEQTSSDEYDDFSID